MGLSKVGGIKVRTGRRYRKFGRKLPFRTLIQNTGTGSKQEFAVSYPSKTHFASKFYKVDLTDPLIYSLTTKHPQKY